MPDPHIFFVSGVPRAGSTLLQNLLLQNPNHHATATNGLLDCLVQVRSYWTNDISFRAQGLERVKPRIIRALRGQVYGFYEAEFDAGQVVFDKSRGWLQFIEFMEDVLEREVRVVVPVRDVKGIVASFEKIGRKSWMTKPAVKGPAFFDIQTVGGRARQILAPPSVVGLSINRLRDALDRGLRDRLVFVPYRDLTNHPQGVLAYIHAALGLEPYADYNPDHVEQVTYEDDSVHGMDLHTIRPKVEPAPEAPWVGVLPSRLCTWIDQEYGDINQLAATSIVMPTPPPAPKATKKRAARKKRAATPPK